MKPRRGSLVAIALCSFVVHQPVVCASKYLVADFLLFKNTTRESSFEGAVAQFGDQLIEKNLYTANLFLPPGDQMLCKYPEAYLNRTDSDQMVHSSRPIALVISRGDCSFYQKALVALEIYGNLSKQLKFVVIYNNDPSNTGIFAMSANTNGSILEDLKTLGFIFVSTESGGKILSIMNATASSKGLSPYLAQNKSYNWSLSVQFEVKEFENAVPDNPAPGGPESVRTFYWLRFVLFSLLIISPCARAGFLWFSGGGRLMFRRNEEGRIVGFLYVRPMQYWFAPGAVEQDEDMSNRRLSEEEVLALPELTYKTPPPDEIPQLIPTADSEVPKQHEQDPEISMGVVENPINSRGAAVVDNTERVEPIIQQREGMTEQRPEEASISNTSGPNTITGVCTPEYTTSCTMCSICIDDFEDGEKIRILPKCRHGFHLECIKPWLIERQGCCPLCKTPVLGHEEKERVADGTESNETQSQHDLPA